MLYLYLDESGDLGFDFFAKKPLFSWGIFRKYEKNDKAWFDVFKGKIKYDDVYLP